MKYSAVNEGKITDFFNWLKDSAKNLMLSLKRFGSTVLITFKTGRVTNIVGANSKTGKVGVGLKYTYKQERNSLILGVDPQYILGTPENPPKAVVTVESNSKSPTSFFEKMLFEAEDPEALKAKGRKALRSIARGAQPFNINLQYYDKSPIIHTSELADIYETMMAMLTARQDYNDPIPSVIIFGASGAGKTEVAEQFMKTRQIAGWNVRSYIVSTISYDSLVGIPSLQTKEVGSAKGKRSEEEDEDQVGKKVFRVLATDLFPTEESPGSGGKWIIFLDEFNRDRFKMEAIMNIISSGKIGDHFILPLNTIVVLAGNTGAAKDQEIVQGSGVWGDGLNVEAIGTDVWTRAKMIKYLTADPVNSAAHQSQSMKSTRGIDFEDDEEGDEQLELAAQNRLANQARKDPGLAKYISPETGLIVKSSKGAKAMGPTPAIILSFENFMATDEKAKTAENNQEMATFSELIDQFNDMHASTNAIQMNARLLTNIGETMKAMALRDWLKTGPEEEFPIPEQYLDQLPKEARTKPYYFEHYKTAKSSWEALGNVFPSAASYYLHMNQYYYFGKSSAGIFGKTSNEIIDRFITTYETVRQNYGEIDEKQVAFNCYGFVTDRYGKKHQEYPLDDMLQSETMAFEFIDGVLAKFDTVKNGAEYIQERDKVSKEYSLPKDKTVDADVDEAATEIADGNITIKELLKSKVIKNDDIKGAILAAFNFNNFITQTSYLKGQASLLGRIYTDLNKQANKKAGDKDEKQIYAQFSFLVHYCLTQLNDDYRTVGERVKGKTVCPDCKGNGHEGGNKKAGICPTCNGIGVIDPVSTKVKKPKNESFEYENQLIEESLRIFTAMKK
jgi:hypothetical protein